MRVVDSPPHFKLGIGCLRNLGRGMCSPVAVWPRLRALARPLGLARNPASPQAATALSSAARISSGVTSSSSPDDERIFSSRAAGGWTATRRRKSVFAGGSVSNSPRTFLEIVSTTMYTSCPLLCIDTSNHALKQKARRSPHGYMARLVIRDREIRFCPPPEVNLSVAATELPTSCHLSRLGLGQPQRDAKGSEEPLGWECSTCENVGEEVRLARRARLGNTEECRLKIGAPIDRVGGFGSLSQRHEGAFYDFCD